MSAIEISDIKRLRKDIIENSARLANMYECKSRQTDKIRKLSVNVLSKLAVKSLDSVSVEELKKSKAGIRVSALIEAGYKDLYSLSQAGDWEIRQISGIGEKQLEAIRAIIAEFINQIISYTTLKLTLDDFDSKDEYRDLIICLYEYRHCEEIRKDASDVKGSFFEYSDMLSNEKIILNKVHWVFSSKANKEHTLDIYDSMVEFIESPVYIRAINFIDSFAECFIHESDKVREDFEYNSADYYALLEELEIGKSDSPLIYSSIPSELASGIDSIKLNIDDFKGRLRAYQSFGAKYIIAQKKVLLGDEMGLGKTIQAIAAMVHINSNQKDSRFLIVCPASVLINWCREIKKFSDLSVHLIHGEMIDDSLASWKERGGVAVTNYESMGRIIDAIDEKMKLSMLVIDEAHYIKNPDAIRTNLIRRLDNESERILLMSGTPLENRVEEMCSLIDFIRPDMSIEIRKLAKMSSVPQFKEMLAPLYLRRTRDQVLEELPKIQDEQEWCAMTDTDLKHYIKDVDERDLTGMRRVSFRQPDINLSSKGKRLIEICDQARDEGRKILIYSYFLDTIDFAYKALHDRCVGVISGETPIAQRQALVDRLSEAESGSVLISQIQSGGTGLNIQAASIVIFLEPQVKPSLEKQAISRVYRMGQVRNVLVYHLLCENTIDEAFVERLAAKQFEFDTFANESAAAEASENLIDKEWIAKFIESERNKYLPMVIEPKTDDQ